MNIEDQLIVPAADDYAVAIFTPANSAEGVDACDVEQRLTLEKVRAETETIKRSAGDDFPFRLVALTVRRGYFRKWSHLVFQKAQSSWNNAVLQTNQMRGYLRDDSENLRKGLE